nr:ABC transporter substrate-binding protein [Micromonospora sp. DSM 115978]
SRVRYDPAGSDLSADVAAIQESQPDVVLFSASSGTGERLASALSDTGYLPPALVVYGDVSEAAPLASHPQLDGRVSRQTAWSASIAAANPRAAAVAERYKAEFGAPMTEAAASAFTAVSVLARAIDDAGSVVPERIRSALVGADLPGSFSIMPWNGVRFDGTHQNVLSGTVIEQASGSTFSVVYPRDLAAGPFNWPNRQ